LKLFQLPYKLCKLNNTLNEETRFRERPQNSSDLIYLSDFRQLLEDRQLRRVDLELERLRLDLKLKVGQVGALRRIEALDRDPFA
jgi:hypothetical protein